MNRWFDIDSLNLSNMQDVTVLAQLNDQCKTFSELLDRLSKVDGKYMEIFVSNKNFRVFHKAAANPKVKIRDLLKMFDVLYEKSKSSCIAENLLLMEFFHTLRIEKSKGPIHFVATMKENTTSEKESISSASDEERMQFRKIFQARNKLKRMMVTEVEKFLLSDQLLNKSFVELQLGKPLDRVVDRVKHIELKRNFQYSNEILQNAVELEKKLKDLENDREIKVLSGVSDPLKDTEFLENILRQYQYYVELNKRIEEYAPRKFGSHKIEFMKFFVSDRNMKQLLKNFMEKTLSFKNFDNERTKSFQKVLDYAQLFYTTTHLFDLIEQIATDTTLTEEQKKFFKRMIENSETTQSDVLLNKIKKKYETLNEYSSDVDDIEQFEAADIDPRPKVRSKRCR